MYTVKETIFKRKNILNTTGTVSTSPSPAQVKANQGELFIVVIIMISHQVMGGNDNDKIRKFFKTKLAGVLRGTQLQAN